MALSAVEGSARRVTGVGVDAPTPYPFDAGPNVLLHAPSTCKQRCLRAASYERQPLASRLGSPPGPLDSVQRIPRPWAGIATQGFRSADKLDAVDRAGLYAEFTAGAFGGEDCVHLFGGPADRVDWAGLNTERTPNAMIFINERGGGFSRCPTSRVQWDDLARGET